jgi:hypothetical protein
MLIVGDGTVILKEGETIPVFCACGHIYQPTPESDLSKCPECGAPNLHWEQEVGETD